MAHSNKNRIYAGKSSLQWAGSKTMEHASGIWGRAWTLDYLESKILKPGDRVLDLGCGGGHITARLAEKVGKRGLVLGVDSSKSQLGLEKGQVPLSSKYPRANLEFRLGNVTKLDVESRSMNAVVSFMVLHNLPLAQVRKVMHEAARVLKPGGKAVFLTMHPEVLDSDWNLSFWNYEPADLSEFRKAKVKEGMVLRGLVKNSGGGEKPVLLIHHERANMLDAIEKAGFAVEQEKSLKIDRKTATAKFGKNSVKKLPSTPSYWVITLKKLKES